MVQILNCNFLWMKNDSVFRRRADRLTWHTNPNCQKWPLKDYVEDQPNGPLGYLMICPKCKELDEELISPKIDEQKLR